MSEQPPNASSTSPSNQTAPPSTSPETKATSNPFFDITDAVDEPRVESNAPVSPPPPAVNAATRPTSETTTGIDENVLTNPAIAELKAMFPDYDEIILISVLQSTNGNQAAAIDVLLGMSDPEYKSEGPPPQAALTQTELDEQLARRLMLEEQQQIRYQDPLAQGFPQRRQSRYGQAQQNPGPQPGDKDTMTEIQEQFTKVAEAGKKTFGSLFTKVKAKIQEFERGGPGGLSSDGPSTQWVGGYDPQAHPHQTQYAPYQHHGAGQPQQQQASYYDPNSPITLSSQTSPPQAVPSPAVQGYDATPVAGTPPPTTSARAGTSPPTTSSSGVPPPNPNSAPIDAGKLGLLPKKPVSLIRDPPSGQPVKRVNSEDDLEYAENPFEDQKK